jgi:CubicO group peptidase (beta-lactamase class C family)
MRSFRASVVSLVVLALLTLVPASASLAAQAAPREVDTYVTQALRRFRQPGVAIAVVKDGKVLFQQGWGVRTVGRPEKVTEHTLFQVASNSKAVTGAALGILVDEGKLRWDDPVTDYLPWFRLGGEAYITREFTVRDLLLHRSGLTLGAGDLMWWFGEHSREEIARALRYITPKRSFRTTYDYDNVLYVVAGLVVEAASGMSWDDFVRTRIFEPLGMTRTQTSVRLFRPGDDVATPHARVNVAGELQVIGWDTVDNLGGGGAINSSVADWAKWLQVQLDSGRTASGTRLWSEARTRELWHPGIMIPVGIPGPAFSALRANFNGYALGWFVRDYRGLKLITHTGGLAGMLSRVFLVPEKKIGVVVLSNGETNAFNALGWWVLDYALAAPRTDWVAAYADAGEETLARDRAFEDSANAARRRDVGPSLPLAKLAGTYRDPWYGDVTLTEEGGHLVLRWSRSPSLTADLEHWQYDTFRARMRVKYAADAFVTFQLAHDGTIDRMLMTPVLPSTDFSFNYQDLEFRPVPRGGH